MIHLPITRRRLLRALDTGRVEAAIRALERRTSGELRVSIVGPFWGSAERFAARAFQRLGMTATAERNGVLLLVLPWRRRLIVLGDEGIHARVGQALWDEAIAAATAGFRQGDYTAGLVRAVEILGDALAAHFPARPDDQNELSNKVDLEP